MDQLGLEFAGDDLADFLEFVRHQPDAALHLLAMIGKRLRKADQLLRGRVTRNVNDEAAQMLVFEQMFKAMSKYLNIIQTSMSAVMNIM